MPLLHLVHQIFEVRSHALHLVLVLLQDRAGHLLLLEYTVRVILLQVPGPNSRQVLRKGLGRRPHKLQAVLSLQEWVRDFWVPGLLLLNVISLVDLVVKYILEWQRKILGCLHQEALVDRFWPAH